MPELRSFRRELLKQGREVGLVPTMGALHDGHLTLIRAAAQENADIFVSIFVNPTQFGVNEDLASYPRTWDTDIQQLTSLDEQLVGSPGQGYKGRIAAIFAPTVKTMYPTLPPTSEIDGEGSFIYITPLGRKLEGASRPVFFRGVATVCAKLFNVVQPDRVYFGQKDLQQSVLIRRMVKDFHMPTEVRIVETIREPDGLAMSSRNVYLGTRRRKYATVLVEALRAAEAIYLSGVTSRSAILEAAAEVINAETTCLTGMPKTDSAPFLVDYISLADPFEMNEIVDDVDPEIGAMLSGAIKMFPVGNPQDEEERAQKAVRLIDNIILKPRPL